MARLFISYKREEQAYAFALRQWLIDKQDWPPHEVFVDRDKLHAGDEWANKIFREAEACEAMLFLASEASLKPDSFCYKELQRARGVTIAVTLGGLRPEDDRLRSALPHGADARQITALDGQPTDAFSYISPVDGSHGAIALNRSQVESIGETLRNLGIAPNSFTWKATDDGPYRGLGALQEGDEALFFGREREIRDCMRILEEIRQSVSDRAFVIQAPSGAGKSSLLRAGLWRRLRRHAGFSPLTIVRARQGILSHEEWGLAAGLAKPEANLLNLPLGVLEDRTSRDLARLLADFADVDASRQEGRRTMLLGIDQAEEMASLGAQKEIEELRRLFSGIAEAAKTLDLRLVFTARDDSIDPALDRLSELGIAHDAVRTYRLNRMPPARFKDVIEKPARVAEQSGFALKFDDALATTLAQAAAQNQGEFSDALPILALALQRLVKKRRSPDGSISADPETASRLISDAVAEAAEEALEAAKSEIGALRQLMIPRLVAWDPRSGEGGAAKRRVATAEELFSGDRAALKSLADALVDQRLLTRAGNNYEVSHEALLRVPPLGALILELRSKFLRADMLTMEARDWIESGRRVEWAGRTGERLRDSQALLADPDFGIMLSAQYLGIAEYLAACAEKDREETELRERLDRYQLASIAGEMRRETRLQEGDTSPIVASRPTGGGAKVYISASRRDFARAEMIREALVRSDFEAFFDITNILPGEAWQERLAQLIASADKVVILISPDSVTSSLLNWEIDQVIGAGKVIVPVIVRDTDPKQIPLQLSRLNSIFLRSNDEVARGIPALIETLSTDLEWIREHTRLAEAARRWDEHRRQKSMLLRGSELAAAERWMVSKPQNSPALTALQIALIGESRQTAVKRSRTALIISTSAVALGFALAGTAYWQLQLAIAANETRSQLVEVQKDILKETPVDPKVGPGKPEFVGRVVLRAGNDGRSMTLLEDFAFKDSAGVSWKVPAGATVDGTSIPAAFWSIVGSPFSGNYRTASILHDYYCQTRSRPWQEVHRMFYEAMIASGVPESQAKLLYASVYRFGPRWSRSEN